MALVLPTPPGHLERFVNDGAICFEVRAAFPGDPGLRRAGWLSVWERSAWRGRSARCVHGLWCQCSLQWADPSSLRGPACEEPGAGAESASPLCSDSQASLTSRPA